MGGEELRKLGRRRRVRLGGKEEEEEARGEAHAFALPPSAPPSALGEVKLKSSSKSPFSELEV